MITKIKFGTRGKVYRSTTKKIENSGRGQVGQMKSKQMTKDKAANQRADKNKGLVQRTTVEIKIERTEKTHLFAAKIYIN